MQDQSISPSARRGRFSKPKADGETTEPRSWASQDQHQNGAHGVGETLHAMRVPMPRGGRAQLFADRVRAAPAVAPQVSFMLGQNAIGLGVWGLAAPGSVNRFLGLENSPEVTRIAFGAREMATGVVLASDPTNAGALWARVAGDAFDIAVLSKLTTSDNPKRGNARIALGVVLAVTALDLFAAVRMSTVKRNCA
jgi:hypothetical protein